MPSPDHDIVQSNIIDDGLRVVCRCQRVFTGPDARERHEAHHGLEMARTAHAEALKGETDG